MITHHRYHAIPAPHMFLQEPRQALLFLFFFYSNKKSHFSFFLADTILFLVYTQLLYILFLVYTLGIGMGLSAPMADRP